MPEFSSADSTVARTLAATARCLERSVAHSLYTHSLPSSLLASHSTQIPLRTKKGVSSS